MAHLYIQSHNSEGIYGNSPVKETIVKICDSVVVYVSDSPGAVEYSVASAHIIVVVHVGDT